MDHRGHARHGSQVNGYVRLLLMLVLSFASMFALMYAMVDRFDHVLVNLNQIYMAGLMTAVMAILEVGLMGHMLPSARIKGLLLGVGTVALVGFWVLIRQQTAIADRQFLRSMIPHHASAILMCANAPIRDPEIQSLCARIVASQQAEIDEMRAKLQQLDAH